MRKEWVYGSVAFLKSNPFHIFEQHLLTALVVGLDGWREISPHPANIGTGQGKKN
jgi:hypothetical protein